MKQSIESNDLGPLAEFITDIYQGDLLRINNDLEKVIYMFHYLPKDLFPRIEVQDACFTLHQIKNCFYSCYEYKKKERKK